MINVIKMFKAMQLEIHSSLSIGQTGRTYLFQCNALKQCCPAQMQV